MWLPLNSRALAVDGESKIILPSLSYWRTGAADKLANGFPPRSPSSVDHLRDRPDDDCEGGAMQR